MLIGDYYKQIKSELAKSDVYDCKYEARIILQEILSVEWADIIVNSNYEISDDNIQKINNILEQRAGNKPLSRILGKREFWGLSFLLNESTLDPRPDTEVLVEKALAFILTHKNDINILDLGTGTGCIPISLLSEIPLANAVAVDISEQALDGAKKNAEAHNVVSRMKFVQSDWFENIQGKYDVITSNPPYIDSTVCKDLAAEVKNHDPIQALDGGESGLDPYKIIFSKIKNHLNPKGRAFLEIGYDQCGYIERIAMKHGIRIHSIHKDYKGIPRVVEISNGDK